MEAIQKAIKTLPHAPGVYLFRSKEGTVLYVGKARDLKKRVSQYAKRDDAIGPKTILLVSQVASVETVETQSEFDAILLEANQIRTYQPKYNAIAKDDKSPLYLVITLDEEVPRVICLRKTELQRKKGCHIYGPFQSGKAVRNILRQLRAIIPYCTQKQRNGRPCFYTHIGQCNPCPSVIEKMADKKMKHALILEYRKNIRRLDAIFSGKSLTVLHDFEKTMERLAKQERFEEAARQKMYVDRLKMLLVHHYDPASYLESGEFLLVTQQQELERVRSVLLPFYPHMESLDRIECIDISNILGTYATGSLVVLRDGSPSTADYRRFRIHTKDVPNDFAMIAEVVRRRMNHAEWPYPDLLVIDGGKGQVAAALAAILSDPERRRGGVEGSPSIPVIGLAKRFEEIIVPIDKQFKTLRLSPTDKALHLLERIRDESHRFALSYHRLLRKKAFL